MKISHKLVGSFVSVSLLTSVVGGVALAQSQKIAETLAIAEAEQVAQVFATLLFEHSSDTQKPISVEHSAKLQNYVMLLHKLQQRDIEIVNRQKIILADAVPEDIGTILKQDQGNKVQQTMQDGKTRTFVEKSIDYPQGIKLIVIPVKTNQSQIDGAVIMEWSSLYDEAIAQARPTIIVIPPQERVPNL